jgi:hypothetical protein
MITQKTINENYIISIAPKSKYNLNKVILKFENLIPFQYYFNYKQIKIN